MSLFTSTVLSSKTVNQNTGSATWLKRMGSFLVVLFAFAFISPLGSLAQNVNVTATLGNPSGTYANVSAAFAAINAGTHQGAITLDIVNNTTEPASPTALLKSALPSSYASVLVKPSGGNRTINSAATPDATRGIIELNGADNVTIDGDDPGTAGAQNLTIQSATSTSTGVACVRISSSSTLGTDGADNVTVKNCIIVGPRSSSTSTTTNYGINMSNYSTTSMSTAAASSINTRIENNNISRCWYGVWANGTSGFPLTGMQILNNTIGSATDANGVGLRGIVIVHTAATTGGALISGNDIRVGVAATGYSNTIAGIEVGTGNFGFTITKNNIHDINQPSTGGWGAFGIYVTGSALNTSSEISNNFIRDCKMVVYQSSTTSSFIPAGVFFSAGATNVKFTHNTVVMGPQLGTGVNFSSLCVDASVSGVTFSQFTNNILVNTHVSTSAYGLYTAATGNISAATVNNNDYYVPGGNVGYYNGANRTTLAAWQTATGKDANAVSANPPFVSATNLHLIAGSATVLESGGASTATTGITTDIDGDARPNGTAPDIGADEFAGLAYTAPVINTVSTTAATCTPSSHAITASVTPGSSPVTSAVINYSVNGVAQTAVTMTGGPASWSGTIPAAAAGAVVSYSVTVSDGISTITSTSQSYKDAPLTGFSFNISQSPVTACAGSPVTLTAVLSAGSAPTYTAPPAVSSPTVDEDLGNVTITQGATTILNNTSARNTLVGTIGTASGTAGSYANYTAFGPYTLVPGQAYSFSVSTLQSTSAFSNAIGIWIDYNVDGDFNDAGENVYTSAATTSGAHTETGSFTVPAGVAGLSRMRVLVNEGAVTGPTMSVSWGEYEEYAILLNPITSYSWSSGGTSNVETVSPTSNTAYTLTGTDANGCTVSSSYTVNVTALPAAPSTFPSTQCGTGVPLAFALGGNPGGYRWYLTPTGGTALAGENEGSLSSYTISATTIFYIAVTNGTCESVRVPVTATVNEPDAVTASASSTSVCLGGSLSLTATKAPGTNTYTYTWTAAPVAGSGIPTSIVTTNANSGSVTPSAPGTYIYSVSAVDGSCLTTSQVTVQVNSLPTVNNVAASPATAVCAGSAVTLSAQSISSGPGLVTLGTGTTTTSTSGITPFNSNWEGSRVQYIIRASELQAAGLLAGDLTSLAFNVTSSGSGTFAQSGYNIKIGHTGATDLTAGYATPTGAFTTVYGPATEPAPAVGVRTYTFASPFNWNGTSNIIIEICHDNDINASCASCFSGSSTVSYTATSYNSVYGTYDDNVQSCGVEASLTSSSVNRPNMVFGGVTGVDVTSSMNFEWNPGALIGASVTTPVFSTETYVVTVTNPLTNCSNSGSVLVNVNPLPAMPTGAVSEQCGTRIPDAAVASNSSEPTPTFKWYDAQTGGNLLQTGTSATYLTPVSVSTTFWVSELNTSTGCESDRVQVDVFVNPPDAISASVDDNLIGVNNPITLSYTQLGTINTYSYSWSASPEAGSGLTNPTPATGDITITPTIPGTYIYTVTGNEGDCNATSSVTVVVRPLPVVTSATATPTASCAGAPVMLKAQSTDASTANATIGAGATTTATYPAAFYSLWSNKHEQIMIRASELTAAGLMAGNLSKISFPVTSADTDVPQGFTIKMAHTANTSMSAFVTTGLTQVYFAATQPFSVGNNTLTLNTPFAWNGTDNLVIDICFGGLNSNTMSCTSPADNTSYVSVIKTHTSSTTASASACGNNTTNLLTYSVRPRIILEGQVGTYNFTNIYTYTWIPGNIVGSTVTVNPTVSTVYSVTATDGDGIVSLPLNVNVTVNPLPGAPATVNSTQCGFGVPTASVSGTGNGTGTFKWYDAASGGTLLQSGTSATYTGSISSSTTLYVSESNTTTGCEGPRSAVTATVTPTDAITASSIPASGCLGNPISLSVSQTGSTQTYTYSWNAIGANAASSGMTGSMSGASVSVIPTAAGTYTYQVVGTDVSLGCAAITTINVTINPKPAITAATATPATSCPGGAVTLNAVAAPIVSATVGTATTTTSTSGATPYTALWEGERVQYLVRASELTAAGLTAGAISSLSFNVTSTSNTFAQNGFTIKMAHTANTAITGAFGTPTGAFTTCYGPTNITVSTTGVKQYLFSNSFNWDGVSNILVDICHDNDINGTCASCFGGNSTVAYTATSFNSVYGIYADDLPNCGQASSSSSLGSTNYTFRPNMVFGAGSINWIWSPGGLTGSSVTVNPTVNTNYTATAVNPATGCSSTSSAVPVTIIPLVCSGITVSPVTCANTNFTLTANATGSTGLTYTWSDGFGTGYPNTASITANLPAGTYNFTVTVTSPCGETCTGTASVTVNSLPVVTVAAGTTTLCGPGTSTTLTASGASTYAWSPATGLSATTGASVTASPISTTTYTVVGTDANGCVAAPVTQQIVVGPSINLTTTATPGLVCPGGTSQLDASAVLGGAFGGQAKTYAFETSTGATLDPMTGASTATGSSNDDSPSSLLNIGFNFFFEGVGYSTFSITPDGFIKLGTVASSQFSNALTSTTNVPKLAAFWDDVATGTNGNVNYLVTGTAPNRILKVQWFVTIPRVTTGAANSTFQAWLYEGSNKIEYRYGTMGATTNGASIGLSGALTTATNFESVTLSTNTMSTTTANDGNLGAPAAGRMYSFTPVQALTYAWSPATFLSNTNTANPVASGVTATTNYTVTVTDPVSGCNTSSTVTVQLDNVAPVPPVLPTATGECFVQLTAPVAVDNCSGNVTGTTPEMLFIDQGTFTVTWTFTDATGNTSTATQTVIVDDVTPPVVPTLATLTGECAVTVPLATAQDECVKTIAGTTTDPLYYTTQGTHIVNWTFDDGNGNVATATQTVVIDDVTPPVITCPSNILLSACTPTATWAPATATDNCAYGLTVTQIAGPAPGSTFANGSTTTITYRATDAGGNQVTCSFTVTRRAALVASATFTPILCNGATSQVTVTAVGGNGTYSGTGTFTATAGTHTYTVTDGEGCTDDVTVIIGQPSAIVTSCSNSNPEIYFGYSADNTATITASATGGTGPYTISFSMDRAMKCNITDAAGDETWVGGAGTASNVNNVCPGAGAGAVPVSTSVSLLAGQTYSVTVKLMANAVITATITDANGCIEKCTTPVFAKDVRCYTGSGIWKVKVCHRTGSGCNSNCINEDAVATHLAHGDFLGDCTPSCTAPAPGGKGISLPITKAQAQVEDVFELAVSPNPTTTEFKMAVTSSNAKDKLLVNLYDATGKLYQQFRATPDQLIRFGRELKAGMYMVEVMQAGRRKTASLVKQ